MILDDMFAALIDGNFSLEAGLEASWLIADN